jgi:peptidoglycan hydrolase-like protein with peptidoglycan-binding domain
MRTVPRIGRAIAVACLGAVTLGAALGGVANADTGPLSVDLTACPQLAFGSTGPCVTVLQEDLKAMGDDNITSVDGIYGPQTEAAVSHFQITYGNNSTGIADPQTLSKLVSDVEAQQRAQNGPSDTLGEVTNDACDMFPWGGVSDICKSFFNTPAG